jgi:tetratricopeptide (TPR) repeat protein
VNRAAPVISRAADADSEHYVLQALYRLSLDVRRALGESPRAIASTPGPTTRSLPAYQAYAQSEAVRHQWDEQIALRKRALESDPGFVDAWAALALSYQTFGSYREARKCAAEAHRLAAGLPEQARLLKEILYLDTLFDYDAVAERLKGYRRLYPLDDQGANWLGWLYLVVVQDPAAAEEPLRVAYEVQPDENDLDMLSDCLMRQGKASEIERLGINFASRTGLNSSPVLTDLYLAFLRRDLKESLALLDRIEREGAWPRFRASRFRPLVLLDAGRFRQAATAAAAVTWGEIARTARIEFHLATTRLLESWLALRRVRPHMSLHSETFTPFENDLVYLENLIVHSVESGQAEPLARVTAVHEAVERGSNSRFVREQIGFAHGTLALIRGQPARAREILAPLTRASKIQSRHHVVGRAYEALGLWREAASAYEEVVGNPHDRALYKPALWVLDQYRLGQIYERLGDGARARHWYGRFVDDWKDADPDIPELTTARRRLEVLGGPVPASD